MAENVENATFESLKGIQVGIADLRSSVDTLRSEMNARFEAVDEQFRMERRNNAGVLVMMRATAGLFEQRITDVEKRLAALEDAQA